MKMCRGAELRREDLDFISLYRDDFCLLVKAYREHLIQKVDEAAQFAREVQDESDSGALNYAITAVRNNVHRTNFLVDVNAFRQNNMISEPMETFKERMIETVARILFNSSAECPEQSRPLIEGCLGVEI